MHASAAAVIDRDAYVLPRRSCNHTPRAKSAIDPAAARAVRAPSPIQPLETAIAKKKAPASTTATAPIRARMRPPSRSSKLGPLGRRAGAAAAGSGVRGGGGGGTGLAAGRTE